MAELAVALYLLHCVLHAPLGGAALGWTRGDLHCCTRRGNSLRYLHGFLFCLLILNFLLLLPLILHILVERYWIILLFVWLR